ncbi:hypothetical protein F5B22DRAFT_644216 [Xylaria bambusicola]|uniref:uncharacterized protein n=1 Tax=Xylaria bambusicola TaxID=326684 RepID=UPI002007A3C6|nr:uncharacterized protein F5B22DRAFT_644216 [Xylaria bambusicola]KAI0520973.1 hypothetical protein F5B22DRAFT_644216 [Xylaria bambusicola]
MVVGTATRVVLRPLFASRTLQRAFSVKAIYSSFPATLLHYSPRNKIDLYDEQEANNQPDDTFDNKVVLKDGLVYPSASLDSPVSNGAVMYPNTFMMQEFLRQDYDDYLDRKAARTPVPSHLVLINDYVSRFSLQPTRGMTLQALNTALNEFFRKHAQIETADTWFKNHPYHLAKDDAEDAEWMAE